jgi:hypothetical protein
LGLCAGDSASLAWVCALRVVDNVRLTRSGEAGGDFGGGGGCPGAQCGCDYSAMQQADAEAYERSIETVPLRIDGFAPEPQFKGPRPGFVFKRAELGLG